VENLRVFSPKLLANSLTYFQICLCADTLDGWSVGRSVSWSVGRLVGWSGWLVGHLVGLLVGALVGQFSEGPHSKDLEHSLKNTIWSARKNLPMWHGKLVDLSSNGMGYGILIHQKLAHISK
jgi:hypothetical protein